MDKFVKWLTIVALTASICSITAPYVPGATIVARRLLLPQSKAGFDYEPVPTWTSFQKSAMYRNRSKLAVLASCPDDSRWVFSPSYPMNDRHP
jgi:hypothetical protein